MLRRPGLLPQQVAYGRECDDVFARTTPLAIARTLLGLAASRTPKEASQYMGLFDITPVNAQGVEALGDSDQPVIVTGEGLLCWKHLSTGLGKVAKQRNSEQKPYSETLSSDGWSWIKVFPRTLYHASQVATSTCHGEDFGLGKVETQQRCVTVSKPRGLLSWVQAETARGAFSNARYAVRTGSVRERKVWTSPCCERFPTT